MEIIETTSKEYKNILPQPYHFFNSVQFTELNADKCDRVFYLLFKDSKIRLGLIVGEMGQTAYTPFSAPFGGFSVVKDYIHMNDIDECVNILIQWCKEKCLKGVRITLPPSIYGESFISMQYNSFIRNGFSIENNDLNFSFCEQKFNDQYENILWRNARKNLTVAFSYDLKFYHCVNNAEKETAYEIIKKNREARGFPLRMTWSQVFETIKIIPNDFFLVKDSDSNTIASAIVFHVSIDIVQVVYWGDLAEYSHLKSMNFLSYKLFDYYHNQNVKIVDIGPSTENSTPNYGLCDFKSSIGCDIQSKFTFYIDLR